MKNTEAQKENEQGEAIAEEARATQENNKASADLESATEVHAEAKSQDGPKTPSTPITEIGRTAR